MVQVVNEQLNDMFATIPKSAGRRSSRCSGLLIFSLLMSQGLAVVAGAYDAAAQLAPGAPKTPRHSLLNQARQAQAGVGAIDNGVKPSTPLGLGDKTSQKKPRISSKEAVSPSSVSGAVSPSASQPRLSPQVQVEETLEQGRDETKAAMASPSGRGGGSGTSLAVMGAASPMAGALSSPGNTYGAVAPGALMGAGSSVVVDAPVLTNKGVQRLLKSIPGLMQVVATPVPPETIAPPAPPLGPPASGLPAAPGNWFGYHVLSRLTFGGTPNQLNAVSHMTAPQARDWGTRYMKEQLGLDPAQPWPTNLHATTPLPDAIPIVDTDTDVLLAAAKGNWKKDDPEPTVLKPELSQLQDLDLIRKIYSRRQLLEKMVYFWDNHFNTDYRSHFRGQYEAYENDAFRALAYGRFVDLVIASGKSPAMMVYLNTDVNRKENPNENYAREVLELHTLGVDDQGHPAGYTQADIVEAAKAFTGWTVPDGIAPGFRFVSSRHSPGTKTVLGQAVAFDGAGPSEGERVLHIAASHPSTARHLAKKLCEYFVSETPSPALIAEVASVFADSGGDIRKVLIAIVTSTDFNDVANYRGLVKTPLEYIVGLYRNLGVWSSRDPFRRRLTAAGQGLYEMPPPTGYKETSEQWLNTHALFHETAMAYEATIPGFGSAIRYGSDTSGGLTRLWLKNLGLKTEEDVLGFFLNLTTDRQVTATEYQIYLATLRNGGGTFSLDSSSTEALLDRTLASILANPRYLYQ